MMVPFEYPVETADELAAFFIEAHDHAPRVSPSPPRRAPESATDVPSRPVGG
jgi:hypothetical protein